MRAFGVFDGGGVKGAALAGCLAAASDQGVEFVGYGGTSAGSIVATLAAAGFSGREIWDLMKTDLAPLKLLDDDGSRLRQAKECQTRANALIGSKKGKVRKLIDAWSLYDEVQSLFTKNGLYAGSALRSSLLRLLKDKLALPNNQTDVTFDDFVRCKRPPLKIVASDISSRRVAKFSNEDTDYGRSVLDAVRASAGYPLLFEPVTFQDGRVLSDGGLASNLPTFLFASEYQLSQYPILAFDLVANPERHDGSLVQFWGDLLGTALEAGDDIIHTLGPGVVPISIPVPAKISTLKVDLTVDEIDELFNAGLNATGKFLGEWPRLKLARDAGEMVQRQLWTIYGDRKLFEPPLYALAHMIEHDTKARGVRTQVMLSTGRPTNSRIVTYSYGFRPGDGDSDLELEEFGGCTGRAYKAKRPTIADLDDAKTSFADWSLTEAQQRKVATDRKSMLSCPILAWTRDTAPKPENLPIIGILSVDSSTPLSATGWFRDNALPHERNLDRRVLEIMQSWSDVISKLLR
ncbi:MAG TPA: patatin-like phospholipase family protein [Bryobacteraceae bacterium]|nr:patatin-like phospholipase family protein [Bryobacteraceae bacterium]